MCVLGRNVCSWPRCMLFAVEYVLLAGAYHCRDVVEGTNGCHLMECDLLAGMRVLIDRRVYCW